MSPSLYGTWRSYWRRLPPGTTNTCHNDFKIRTVNMTENERPNGHAHCQHLLMSTSEIIPIIDGKLQFGRWQSVFFVELDGPSRREVILQILGE